MYERARNRIESAQSIELPRQTGRPTYLGWFRAYVHCVVEFDAQQQNVAARRKATINGEYHFDLVTVSLKCASVKEGRDLKGRKVATATEGFEREDDF